MALPTFAGFSLQDTNFITERVVFKGYASRQVIMAMMNRREGAKLLNAEFGKKTIVVEGRVVAASASELQTLLDNMKKALTAEEGNLQIESGRTFVATVPGEGLEIPDEHYSQTTTRFRAEFVCSNPFAQGDQLSVTMPVTSGVYTFSGSVNISGTLFNRPTITNTPPSATGNTLIRRIDIYHTPTGQTVTIYGFASGGLGGLNYQNQVTVNMDTFASLEGTGSINNSGAFARWEPGTNEFVITASGRAFPGGSVTLTYNPRYL